jgi:hypothetical protein
VVSDVCVCVCVGVCAVQGPFAVGAQKLEDRTCGNNTAPPLVHFWWVVVFIAASCSLTSVL